MTTGEGEGERIPYQTPRQEIQSMPPQQQRPAGEAGEIDNPMQYIDTEDPAVIAHFKAVNGAAHAYYQVLLAHAPRSRERTIAITKLQEARMWANAAIAFDGKTYPL